MSSNYPQVAQGQPTAPISAALREAICKFGNVKGDSMPLRPVTFSMRCKSIGLATFLFASISPSAVSLGAADTPTSSADDISAMRLPANDPRQPVNLLGEDRAYVLGQMRLFLANVQRMTEALSKNDLVQVEHIASISGAKRNDVDPSRPIDLRAHQPAAWNQYIGAVRKQFDDIASTSPSSSPQVVLGKISELTKVCVACHQVFRITENVVAGPGSL